MRRVQRRRPLTPEEQAFFDGFTPIKIRRPVDDYGPNDRVQCLIVGDHPHAGKKASFPLEDGKFKMIAPLGIGKPDMIRVDFDQMDDDNIDACYVTKRNLQILHKAA